MFLAATSGADAAVIVALLIVFFGIPTAASMFRNSARRGCVSRSERGNLRQARPTYQ